MVVTGRRCVELERALIAAGFRPTAHRPPAPRLPQLPDDVADRVRSLYLALGGSGTPLLRPGPWDLAFADGLVIELDEELHFNRFRSLTLRWSGATPKSWTEDYLKHCASEEPACVRAGSWGKRWTSPSSVAMFGPGGSPGDLTGVGSPRWKQRALYDAVKDEATGDGSTVCLVRLSVHDGLGGHTLGEALDGRTPLDVGRLRALVARRAPSLSV